MKLFYRIYRLLSGMRYRIGRRFTRTGLAVFGAAALAAAMGPDIENNLAYQAFTVLSAMLLVGFIWIFFFRGRFQVERLLPRFATVGQPLFYRVRVRNLTRRKQGGLTLLEDLEDSRPDYKEWLALKAYENRQSFRLSRADQPRSLRAAVIGEGAIPTLPPHQETDAQIELIPLKRGLLRFKGVTIARPDPIGLFRAFSRVRRPENILILPRRYPIPAIALPGTMKYQEGGVAMASHVGQSEDFIALRDYRHGDPLRHIHWRSWARVGRPVVKEFEDEFFVRHALVLDTFTRLPYSLCFEEAVSIAASFACTINTQESLLDLLFVGTESFYFTAGRGLAHADQMLSILASVKPCHDKPFASLEHLVLTHVKNVSGCICVLLDWDEPRREFVRKLRSLGIPVLVLVVADEGRASVQDAGPMRDDPERFRVIAPGKVEETLAHLE